MQKAILNSFFAFSVAMMTGSTIAEPPPSTITSVNIVTDAMNNYTQYANVSIIGICMWMSWSWDGPQVETTLEMDEYQPDLIVTVFDQPGDDPWFEANTIFDPVAHLGGSTAVNLAYGDELNYGANNSMPQVNDQTMRTYVVDVIGDPFDYLHMPWMLRSDTNGYMPYYSSDLDAASDRMGLAELLQLNTYNPFGYYVGPSMFANWGYLYPRIMTLNQPNNYEGSIMAGLHSAAIVTNRNYLHVVQSTADSCGVNCAVANVNTSSNTVWEEVYPYDKQIQMGEMDIGSITPVGSQDNQAGNGNYVFQLWRHYRGCIQGDGSLIYTTVTVPPTQKM